MNARTERKYWQWARRSIYLDTTTFQVIISPVLRVQPAHCWRATGPREGSSEPAAEGGSGSIDAPKLTIEEFALCAKGRLEPTSSVKRPLRIATVWWSQSGEPVVRVERYRREGVQAAPDKSGCRFSPSRRCGRGRCEGRVEGEAAPTSAYVVIRQKRAATLPAPPSGGRRRDRESSSRSRRPSP